MPVDVLARPVIDALIRAFDRAREARLKRSACLALSQAIAELIRIRPDIGEAEAKIAVAKAAGIIDRDLFIAERMLRKVKKAVKREAVPAERKPRKRPAARRRAVRSRKVK
ncbi:MAG TPA: hypothetical protein VFB20_02645 [Burkholderiales bacterium]|nr:hypothetical protein [Burkholderiales bacterium]